MSAMLEESPSVAPILERFCTAAADDLQTLALLHDRELDRDLILRLWRDCYEDFLALRFKGTRASAAVALLRAGLSEIPAELGDASLDHLAADYADIYLTYAVRASPCESVWLDPDNLALQEPMFRVRSWYRRYGLAVEDWRKRSDDHLVYELHFLAHLMGGGSGSAKLDEAARFMDEHLLRWVDRFAERVASRCATRFYAGLALLTAAYLEELRDLLAELLDTPRPTADALDAQMAAREALLPLRPDEVEGPCVPGLAPSW